MRLFKRRKKNGQTVWFASWTQNGETIRKSTRCSTKPAAELVVARWERELADPIFAAANEATLGSELLIFIEQCNAAVRLGNMSPDTVRMYLQKGDNLLRLIGKATRLASIDATMVSEYVETRLAERGSRIGTTVSEATVYKEWVTLSQILKSARHRERYTRDPAAIRPPRLTNKTKSGKRWLEPCEIVRLLDVLDPLKAAPVAYAISSGARRKEVFSAQRGDATAIAVRLRGTKTERSDREIPVPAPFAPLMERALRHGPPFGRWSNSRRDIINACARAGIAPCTWNDFRRTFGSLLVWRLGVDKAVVAQLCGHTTTHMMDVHYAKSTTDSLGSLLDHQIRTRS